MGLARNMHRCVEMDRCFLSDQLIQVTDVLSIMIMTLLPRMIDHEHMLTNLPSLFC